ncbi:galactan 5-O-arabinofuranosyltransferase [Salinifilum aidingensis]
MTGILPSSLLTGPGPVDEPHRGAAVRLTLRTTIAELLLGTAVSAVVSLLIQFAITRFSIIEPSNAPEALAVVSGALVLAALLGALVFGRRHRPRWLRLGGIWAGLSTFVTFVLAIPLHSTRFYFGGSSVDNGFRLQYMTRMAENTGLVDMNYAHLAPYYPAGWFWLGGRFANLIGWEGWAAYKPYALTWVAVTAVVAFTLWSIVVRRRLAALAALVTALTGMLHGIEEPYAWPSAAWLLPIAALTWQVLRHEHPSPRWVYGLIGCYVGFAAVTYTLHFGFAVLLVVTMAVIIGAFRVRAGRPRGATALRLFLRLLPIGLISLVLALLVWTPYLIATDFLLNSPRSAAQHYLPESGAYLPIPMTEADALGVLALAGLVWLILRCRSNEIAAAMLTVVLAVYAWFALSTLALVAETTLLAFRLNVVLDAALAVTGVFALVDVIARVRRRAPAQYAVRIGAVSFAAAFFGAMTLAQTAVGDELADSVTTAHEDYYPNGTNAFGGSDRSQPGAETAAVDRAIRSMTGRAPQENVLLTTDYKIMSFRPYWGFQQETPHYANPLAEYDRRAAEIERWSGARSGEQLARMLDSSAFAAPNALVLRLPEDGAAADSGSTSGDLSLELKADAFPQDPNVHDYQVFFDPAVFDSPEFEYRDVGQYRVIVRH